jgi:hypothetical protein
VEKSKMSVTMSALKDHYRDLQEGGALAGVATVLAKNIRRRMAECLAERERMGVDYMNTFVYDASVCASHDYLDANMVVFDALADYCERELGINREYFIEHALSAEEVADADGAVLGLMNRGWDRVKAEGFSDLWQAEQSDAIRSDVSILLLKAPSSASGDHPLARGFEEKRDEVAARIGADGAAEDIDTLSDVELRRLVGKMCELSARAQSAPAL